MIIRTIVLNIALTVVLEVGATVGVACFAAVLRLLHLPLLTTFPVLPVLVF